MNSDIFQNLLNAFPQLQSNELLSRHCTIRTGGPATGFLAINNQADLIKAVRLARELKIPLHILGGGSNTLFADSGFDGLVIKNLTNHITIGKGIEEVESISFEARHEAADPKKYVSFLDLNYEERPGDTLVKAESGTNLTGLIVKTLGIGLTGLQWFGGIPGVIGGAIYNNIHGGTHYFGERLVSVEVLDESGEVISLPTSQLELDYDFSRFHRTKEIILSGSFLLTKANNSEEDLANQTFREWVKRKAQMQPRLGSMGSTFQNISANEREKIGAPTSSAGWLIDQCQLKGQVSGGAQISPEHANFIVNLGTATSRDVYSLMQMAKAKVKQKFGLDLKEEVFLVGDFS